MLQLFQRLAYCFLAGYLLLAPSKANACSCASNPSSIRTALKEDKAILLIKIIDENFDYPYIGDLNPDWIKRSPAEEERLMRQTATVRVKKMWKGTFRETLTYSAVIFGTCSYFLQAGKTYLFYGGQKDNRIGSSVCSPTSSVENKEVEMGFLDRAVLGNSPEQLQEYLLGILESNQAGRIRAQTLPLLKQEWIEKFHRGLRKTKFIQRAWQRVSKDPAPEVHKYSLELMDLLYYTKEDKLEWAIKHVKDESAIVRQEAARHLWHKLYDKKKPWEEIKILLKTVVTEEKEMALTESPRERKAQREMIQDILNAIIRHENDEVQPWMLPYFLKDIDSEFPKAQFEALYNLTKYKNPSNDEKREILISLMRVVKRLIDHNTTHISGAYWLRNTPDHFNQSRIIRNIPGPLSYLIQHRGEDFKAALLKEILDNLDNKHYYIRDSLLKVLKEVKSEHFSQQNEIRSTILSIINKEKELASNDQYPKSFQSGIVQHLIGYLIENNLTDDIQQLMPYILHDFKNDYRGVSGGAYSNLQKLKPLDEGILEKLEEVHKNADPRSQPRIRKWINQLKRPN